MIHVSYSNRKGTLTCTSKEHPWNMLSIACERHGDEQARWSQPSTRRRSSTSRVEWNQQVLMKARGRYIHYPRIVNMREKHGFRKNTRAYRVYKWTCGQWTTLT
jgi:hypothetical protein